MIAQYLGNKKLSFHLVSGIFLAIFASACKNAIFIELRLVVVGLKWGTQLPYLKGAEFPFHSYSGLNN